MAPRRIFYERQRGGFNNARLQFESLVALAAVTERQLVLPPPSRLRHLDDLFHELDVWSAAALASVISIRFDSHELADAGAWRLDRPLHAKPGFGSYPSSEDWRIGWFTNKSVVIPPTQFECLEYQSDSQRQKAAEAVFHGVRFKSNYVEKAHSLLVRNGLEPGRFGAMHLRREDFSWFAPEAMLSGEKIAADAWLQVHRVALGPIAALHVTLLDFLAINK